MEKLEVIGSKKLKGNIKISGSKNASLPILAATLISNKKIKIQNLPIVKDIQTMIFLLRSLVCLPIGQYLRRLHRLYEWAALRPL